MIMISSAYVHVPFCASICAYCDFTRWRYRPQLCARWLCRLREEASAKLKEPLKTLYIGGGTPSALDRDQLEQLLEIFDPYRAQLENTPWKPIRNRSAQKRSPSSAGMA
ncbi:MAG: hypothetical protein ACLTCB_01140 [Merdibacter sp.]